MAHDRRFRFGVQFAQPIAGLSWADTARKVEDCGFSTLFLPDHFGDQLAPVPAMMAAADATTTLNVGALVLDNDYKHPLVTAKEIATIDQLSGGRVEFGLGSGWMKSDYDESGIAYDAPGVRVERFFEAVEIIKGLWGNEPVTFAGNHYTITNHNGLPKPTRPGGPPLLIGGGARRMLRFAGAHADIVGVNPSIHSGAIDADAARDAAADRFEQKLNWVKEGAGDRFDDLELNVLVFLAQVTDDAAGLAEAVAPMFNATPEMLCDTPAAVFGTIDEICDTLRARRDRWGVSYYVFQGDAMDAMLPVAERLTGS